MALTLPSSNGASYHTSRPETIQLNSHFNGGLTQTTATVTPTRLKNIEEAFLEHSALPPKPVLHEHMAGFVTPSVNISLFVKPPANFNNLNNLANLNHHQPIQPESHQHSKSFDHYYNSSTNSNSNDSFAYSDDYSSEASSTALDNSNASFANLIVDMNSSSSSSRGKKSSNSTATISKSRSKSSTNMAGSSQKQPKKSTGGGRKPTKIDKLTPEEEMKRAKRRERNKLAAARCRKRRLDQTNDLSGRTQQLENEHDRLVDDINNLLSQMTRLKKTIEAHEEMNCKSKTLRLQVEVFSKLDFDVMSEAMKPLMDEDSLSEMPDIDDDNVPSPPQPTISKIKMEPVNSIIPNISGATSVIVSNSSNSLGMASGMIDFANAFSQQQLNQQSLLPIIAEPDNGGLMLAGSQKRKRPNSLPVSSAYKPPESSTNPDALQTPSHGLIFAESTGLTPLVPTLTPSLMTPSTMAAFVKSLGSPSDEADQKKLIAI